MTKPLISIIVLNWQNATETINCITSLLKLNYNNFNIIVCDNDSHDSSVSEMSNWCQSNQVLYSLYNENDINLKNSNLSNHIYIIKNNKNYGYAGGNNIGIKFALKNSACEYVWVLNNDTSVHPESLESMFNKMESTKGLGVCGSLLLHESDKDIIQAAGGVFNAKLCTTRHLLENRLVSTVTSEEASKLSPDYAVGASMLIKREVFENIGILFEDYFLYYEEIDFALRVKKQYKIAIDFNSHVYHKLGDSIKRGKSELADYLSVRNRLIVSLRFYPQNFAFVWLSLIIVFVNRCRRRQFKRAQKILTIMFFDSWKILFKYKAV